MIDLDNSVFMNFKRYCKQEVTNCFKADMRISNFENLIKNETDVSTKDVNGVLRICSKVIMHRRYAIICDLNEKYQKNEHKNSTWGSHLLRLWP